MNLVIDKSNIINNMQKTTLAIWLVYLMFCTSLVTYYSYHHANDFLLFLTCKLEVVIVPFDSDSTRIESNREHIIFL